MSRKYFVLFFFSIFPSLSSVFAIIATFSLYLSVCLSSERTIIYELYRRISRVIGEFLYINSPLMKFCPFVSRTFIFGWSAFSFSFVAFNE